MKFHEWLQEAQGKGTGREYDGGSDICKCPECGYETIHQKGIPCNQIRCPQCGSYMGGKERCT